MRKNTIILLCFIFGLVTLTGCTGPCKVMTIFNKCPHERPYQVYGRVIDMQCNPVEDCKIVLIKRKYCVISTSCKKENGEVLGEYPIALTNKTGDYSFCFEPLEANDVWLYFDARKKGYIPQYVELNHLMGPTFLQTPGNSPVIVDMVLEKPI